MTADGGWAAGRGRTTGRARAAALAGFGQSRLSRYAEVPLGEHAIEAAQAALADAGLNAARIDGVACARDQPFATDQAPDDGISLVTSGYLIDRLGLSPAWSADYPGTVGNALVDAIDAVESGRCDCLLLFGALHSPAGRYGHTAQSAASGDAAFKAPYGLFAPAAAAQAWTRYQHRYRSGSRDQMAAFVVQARANGLDNSRGYWAQSEAAALSPDDYLSAPLVSTPLSRLDCDIPVQVAGAFVITTAERARDLRRRPAFVRGVGRSRTGRAFGLHSWSLERATAEAADIGADLWRNAGCGPTDIDVADIYDGFSIIAIHWLEGLGFCPVGEAFEFIQDGRIARDGALPVNPSGGSLGSGRLHGINHLMDGMLQVTDRAGATQIPGAELALVTIGPPSCFAGAIVLGREPA